MFLGNLGIGSDSQVISVYIFILTFSLVPLLP
jgi:hypothetical protein